MAILFTRVMFLSPLIFAVSIVTGSVLQASNRFLAFAAAPLAYNLGIIIGAVYFEPLFGPLGLAEGVVLGAFLHLLVQAPALLKTGLRWVKVFNYKDEGTRRVLKLMLPRSFGLAAAQMNWMILNALATTLGMGTVTALNFAFNLHYVPIALVGISAAVASFPTMSREALNDRTAFKSRIAKTIKAILLFIVPLSIIFWYFREYIVGILLGTGIFGARDVELTAEILGFFTLGVFAQSIIPIMARSFYAMQNTRIPVISGAVSMAASIFLAFSLTERLGATALPLSYSLAGILNAAILAALLRNKLSLK